jgi:hypothetical protein
LFHRWQRARMAPDAGNDEIIILYAFMNTMANIKKIHFMKDDYAWHKTKISVN